MITYVLDSSAVLRYFDDGAGADRVEEVLSVCASRKAYLTISALQWGEIAGKLRKRFGEADEIRFLDSLLPSEATIVSATADRAVHAAALKVDRNIAYADAFALELAIDSPDHVLLTADYGFKAVDDLARIEFLPAK
ncbi:MAG: PIN domain-containing protein [Terracidiphilus sp.]|jgi:ribonuclease VapC